MRHKKPARGDDGHNKLLTGSCVKAKGRTTYTADTDYVFAGDAGKPRWKDSILADYLKPAATRAGIGNVGWHTFRRTYSTLLHSFGTAPVVQKELLRHADIPQRLTFTAVPYRKRSGRRLQRWPVHCGGAYVVRVGTRGRGLLRLTH